VLDLLGGGDEGGIQGGGVPLHLQDLAAFLDDAFHALALLAFGLVPALLEDLLQPLELGLGLLEVLLERLLQVWRVRRALHLGERAQDLLFGIVQVAQLLHEEGLQGVHLLALLWHAWLLVCGRTPPLTADREGWRSFGW
jgi:hypothetical protein